MLSFNWKLKIKIRNNQTRLSTTVLARLKSIIINKQLKYEISHTLRMIDKDI